MLEIVLISQDGVFTIRSLCDFIDAAYAWPLAQVLPFLRKVPESEDVSYRVNVGENTADKFRGVILNDNDFFLYIHP